MSPEDGLWTGVFCDDPAERVGEYAEPADDRGVLWEDLTPEERAYLSRTAQR